MIACICAEHAPRVAAGATIPKLAPTWKPGAARVFPRSALAFRVGASDWRGKAGLEFVHPSRAVIGWGADPAWWPARFEPGRWAVHFQRLTRHALNAGALVPTNVDLITATPREFSRRPELLDARCRDHSGELVVVPWFTQLEDGESQAWWSCTNHPAYRAHVRDRVRQGFEAGANALHVDDIAGSGNVFGLGGCFCEWCLRGFPDYLRKRLTPRQLAWHGIRDLHRLDYGAMVKARIGDIKELRRAYWHREVCPLVQEYARYSSRRAAAFAAELGELARELGGPDTPLCVNAWSLDPMYTAFYAIGDYFGAEVNHLSVDARGTALPEGNDSLASMLVDEERAVLAYRIADALGKPLCATLPGGNYGFLRKTNALNLLRRWEALAYASGHHFMHAERGWVENGHFDTPPQVAAWALGFVDAHRGLFDGYEPIKQVGLFYDLARERYRWRSPAHRIVRQLANANVHFGVVIGWDDWADCPLAETDVAAYPVVVVPDPERVNPQCRALVQNWLASRRAVPWTGVKQLTARVEPLVTLAEPRPVWVLPRSKPNNRAAPIVVHLLNRSYDLATDTIARQENLVIRLAPPLLDGRRIAEATLFSPAAKPTPLELTPAPAGVDVSVPRLGIWGILHIPWR